MREVGDGLWVHEEPLSIMGARAGRRMSVVRLEDGGLLVHSPTPRAAVRDELDALGPVRFAVAASAIHGHLSLGDYAEAELWAAPGLDVRRKDLVFAGVLGSVPDPRWAGVLDQAAAMGHRLLTEIVFLHKPSRSLLIGDLAVNVEPGNLSERLWAGPGGRLRPARPYRLDIRDRRQARAAIDRILEWDFDRIVVGHGDVIETGGREALRSAYAFLQLTSPGGPSLRGP